VRCLHVDTGQLSLTDAPRPSAVVDGQAEAVVRVVLAGICSTDRELTRGYMGFRGVPGHEFVGIVADAPMAPGWLGRRVVGEINAACRHCATCIEGFPSHCPTRTVLGILGRSGSHAEYLRLPVQNLHAVSDRLSDEEAVFVEPLAAAFEPLHQGLQVEDKEPAIVVGDGKLGLLQARVLALAGASVTLIGKHPRKLALAEQWGLRTSTVDALPAERVRLVAECSGSSAGLELALRLVRPRGTLILKSTFAGQPAVNLAPIVVDEITVMGSRCGPFPEALAALLAEHVRVRDLIDQVLPLERGIDAYEVARQPGVLKVLLRT
jgi:threonine dehydrogenase-like Zn-dependent dehydrogenase